MSFWTFRSSFTRRGAAGFLHPGETIHAVFGAMTYSGLKAAPPAEWGCGETSTVFELPRSTRLGPPTGLLWHVIPVGKEKLRVHRRFFKDIRAADTAMRAGA